MVSPLPEVDSVGRVVEDVRLSLRSGLLFNDLDEPVDDYGKRLLRKVLTRIERAALSERAPETPREGK